MYGNPADWPSVGLFMSAAAVIAGAATVAVAVTAGVGMVAVAAMFGPSEANVNGNVYGNPVWFADFSVGARIPADAVSRGTSIALPANTSPKTATAVTIGGGDITALVSTTRTPGSSMSAAAGIAAARRAALTATVGAAAAAAAVMGGNVTPIPTAGVGVSAAAAIAGAALLDDPDLAGAGSCAAAVIAGAVITTTRDAYQPVGDVPDGGGVVNQPVPYLRVVEGAEDQGIS